MSSRGLRVVVTVGMGRWPFDRLLRAVAPLDGVHDVWVQRGTSDVALACASTRFVTPSELAARMRSADVVVTHAGNTVRQVERLGKLPIAVAREAARGEMGNDHQVRYLRHEVARGRVVALWDDLADLPDAVAAHPAVEAARLTELAPVPEPDPAGAWRRILHELRVEAVLR